MRNSGLEQLEQRKSVTEHLEGGGRWSQNYEDGMKMCVSFA